MLMVSSYLGDSMFDIFIGKHKTLYRLDWDLLWKKAPGLLGCEPCWDESALSFSTQLESVDCLTFDAFQSWLYHGSVPSCGRNDRLGEHGSPGDLWLFAHRWDIIELQNLCMDRITYAFFVDHGRITCTTSEVNNLYNKDSGIEGGKMRKFLVMAFVESLGKRNPTELEMAEPPFNADFWLEVRLRMETNIVYDSEPYVYNHLDFHIQVAWDLSMQLDSEAGH